MHFVCGNKFDKKPFLNSWMVFSTFTVQIWHCKEVTLVFFSPCASTVHDGCVEWTLTTSTTKVCRLSRHRALFIKWDANDRNSVLKENMWQSLTNQPGYWGSCCSVLSDGAKVKEPAVVQFCEVELKLRPLLLLGKHLHHWSLFFPLFESPVRTFL